jgi:hypothetical protein
MRHASCTATYVEESPERLRIARLRMEKAAIRYAILALAFVLGMAGVVTAQAASKMYAFMPHGAFFSVETKPANLIDPQAFVVDPAAPAATGPQGIAHVAGVRPAYGVDDPRTAVVNAQGKQIGFTLAEWFGARGTVTLTPGPSSTTVTFELAGLKPGGLYSFFENHFRPDGVTFTPLDGTAKTNTFRASARGTAAGTIVAPGAITHAEAVLLVYHSDDTDHGMERGQIGVTAHHQLIVRVP